MIVSFPFRGFSASINTHGFQGASATAMIEFKALKTRAPTQGVETAVLRKPILAAHSL